MDLETVWRNIWGSAKPPPKLTVSEWADEYGVVVNGSERGKWSTRPPQKAILDAFSEDSVEYIVAKKSARIGWTAITGHVIGYFVHQNPCSQLMVQPTIDDAQSWSKEDLQPVIEETPVIKARIGEARSRDSKTTILKKHYPGGVLHINGANSARGFRRISVKNVLFDEVDGYPATAGNEGDQIELGTKRTDDYYDRKIGIGSTPTDDGVSRVQKEINQSSQGYFMVPCPDCGGFHTRLFRQPNKPIKIRGKELPVSYLKWKDSDAKTAKWLCPKCNLLIGHEHHNKQLRLGYWFGEDWSYKDGKFDFLDSFTGRIGFNIWAGFGNSPNTTPVRMVDEFLRVKDDQEKLKTFVNTVLGEVWVEPGVSVDEESLYARVEEYGAELPEGVIFLTAYADIQEDRIEYEVVGWSPDQQSWSIDYQVLFGDTTQKMVWDDLKHAFKAKYSFSDGRELSIGAMGIDSGYLPTMVRAFVKDFNYQHCYYTKGSKDGANIPIVEDRVKRKMRLRKRKKGGSAPEIIGVHEAKTVLFRRLKLEKPGPGYCHFGSHCDLDYFEQLTAEKLITRYQKGRAIREYQKIRPRNEVLDIRVGNHATLLLANPDWSKWANHINKPIENKTPARRARRVLSKGIR